MNDESFSMLANRKRKLEDTSQLKHSADRRMDLAKQERKILHVTKDNSFKRTIKEMELEVLQKK